MSLLILVVAGSRILVHRCALAVLLTVLVGALPAVAYAADPPLSLAEAQRLAVERSRRVSAEDAALVAVQHMAVAAGQLPDPVVTVGLDSWPVDGAHRFSVGGDDFTMGRVAVSQEWTRASKRHLRAQHFDREGEKTRAEKAVLIATIQRETASAWLERHYAEAMAALIVDQKKAAELEITAADAAYRSGRGTQADLIATRSALAELDDRANDIDQRLLVAKTALARWVGDAAELPLAGKPDLESVRVDVNMLEMELSHHPEIAVLDRQEELAWNAARLAEADKRADWSVALAYAQRGAGFSDFVSVSVSIPLQWDQANRQDREVAAKLALAEQVGAERDEALRSEVGEVRGRVQAWQSGRQRLKRYERELIPLAVARTEATLAAFAAGRSSTTEILRARRDEIDLHLRMLELEMGTARLWAQLNFLFPDDEAPPLASTDRDGAIVSEASK